MTGFEEGLVFGGLGMAVVAYLASVFTSSVTTKDFILHAFIMAIILELTAIAIFLANFLDRMPPIPS